MSGEEPFWNQHEDDEILESQQNEHLIAEEQNRQKLVEEQLEKQILAQQQQAQQQAQQQKKTQDKKLTVIICVPGCSFSNKFLNSWTETLSNMIKSDKYEICFSNKYSSHVNFARALCLGANVLSGPNQKPFQGKLDYDVILWLDSDMVFNYHMLEYLIDNCYHNYPVVSGLYAMDGGKQFACVKTWDIDYFSKNGTFEFLTVEKREEYLKQGVVWIKCAYSGMGCMAIKKGIFEDERLKYPWFFSDLKKLPSANPEIPYICHGMSEDVSFIRNLIESGIIDGVGVSLKIRLGHEKTIVY